MLIAEGRSSHGQGSSERREASPEASNVSSPHQNDYADRHHHDHGGHRHAQRGGIGRLLASVFTRHSHDAPEAVDTALETSAEGLRALKISLAALALTALVQLGVVMVSGSVALFADTVHNFADALTAVPLGVAFWLGRRPATRRYTYGYGRAEDLAGIFIVATIALSAAVAGCGRPARPPSRRAQRRMGDRRGPHGCDRQRACRRLPRPPDEGSAQPRSSPTSSTLAPTGSPASPW